MQLAPHDMFAMAAAFCGSMVVLTGVAAAAPLPVQRHVGTWSVRAAGSHPDRDDVRRTPFRGFYGLSVCLPACLSKCEMQSYAKFRAKFRTKFKKSRK